MKRLAILLIPLLYGCGGSGSDSHSNQPAPMNSDLSIALSDAPADGADHVVLHLEKVVLTPASHMGGHHQGQDPIEIDMHQHHVDMLAYQGEHAYPLITNHPVPTGRYHVEIHWQRGTGDQGSYVEDGLGKHPLHGYSGHFDMGEVMIHEGQHHGYTLEMDLRQGLHHSEAGYYLGEQGMRWVDDSTMGHLMGTVDQSWIEECEATYPELAGSDSQFTHVAYLYSTDTSLANMDDMAFEAESDKILPLATSWIHQNHDGDWQFGIGFLPAGTYQVGYTCLGHLDLPDSNETDDSGFALFRDGGTVTIESGAQGGHRNEHRCGG